MQEKRKKILQDYLENISPMMIEFEDLSNEFPVGVFNEVRAVFFHLAKYELLKEDAEKKREIDKAEHHMVRARRDCYKYICVAYEEIYRQYLKHLDRVQMQAEDKEEKDLLNEIELRHAECVEQLTKARRLENAVDSYKRDDEIYAVYEEAQKKYRAMYEKIRLLYAC